VSRLVVGTSPRQRVEAECARRGRQAVVRDCASLLLGDDSDGGLIVVLGGAHARLILDSGLPESQAYWLRVWAGRGLLWALDEQTSADALDAVRAGLADPAWRVREMAAKVVARHSLGDLLSAVVPLRADAVARVRAAAHRAVAALTKSGA
jgi:hypothetical protein